ncbi:MAG: hypothetical protein MMC33_004047 [Icmadophila ericetorum]|nr:hypothetical protein [Icmadophila ericetorum]
MPSPRTEAAEHCLLPELVDKIANTEPEALWGEYPKSSTSYDSGFGTVSYSSFANAVNGVAHSIEKALGRSHTSEVLAYLAPNSPQCAITFIAAMKAGFQVLIGPEFLDILKYNKGDWATLAPLTLETISKNMKLLDDIVPNLKMLTFSGGSLPKVFGDIIATRIKLTSLLGSTESGPLPTMYQHGYDYERDWSYIQIHPTVGAKFDPQPGDVFELVYERSPSAEPHQTVFTFYPDLNEFRTKDLFSRHPSYPEMWTHASRSDDVIVFLNGEKTNPIIFESHVAKHSEVAAALVFGNQRFEAGLLIELYSQEPQSTLERARVIERLWPTIKHANSILPAYAQISQSQILFTDPGGPVLRTLKGSIRRQATLDQYAPKINQLYADVEAAWAPASTISKTVDLATVESATSVVLASLKAVTKIGEIDQEEDFFVQGMDSLQVLRLVRYLRIKTGLDSVQPSTIYLHSSVASLAQSLHEIAHNTQASEIENEEKRRAKITEMFQKYSAKVDGIVASSSQHTNGLPVNPSFNVEKHTVVLTGSTGAIGSYILKALMEQPSVEHIYCLNRSPNSADLQKKRNANLDASLPRAFPEDKVTFLTTDLAEERALGLVPSMYQKISRTVSLIIHNAWTVDFNIPLQSYETQIASIVNLTALSAHSTKKPPTIFLSSIGAVLNFASTMPPSSKVPEAIIDNPSAPATTGYGESKNIAERLLAYATQKLDLRGSLILRLGQIAGAARSSGRWNPNEWIPSLVLGSRHIGAIPDSLGDYPLGVESGTEHNEINWLPIDTLADVVVELGLKHSLTQTENSDAVDTSSNDQTHVYHPFNPHRTSWSTLLPSILSALEKHSSTIVTPKPQPIEIVPRSVWLEKLRASAASVADSGSNGTSTTSEGLPNSVTQLLQSNPALKLLEFYETQFGDGSGLNSSNWETGAAEMASEKLRGVQGIDGEMMERWVQDWCRAIESVGL